MENYLLPNMYHYFHGLLLGLGLVIAIGPQNLLVIRKSLESRKLGCTAALTSAGADLVVIVFGASLLAPILTDKHANWISILAGFYLLYCANDSLSASPPIEAAENIERSKQLLNTIRSALLYSVLNPWAWFDAVIVIGGSAMTTAQYAQNIYILGAASASFLWFTSVCLLSSLLKDSIAKGNRYRIFSMASALVLSVIACDCLWRGMRHYWVP